MITEGNKEYNAYMEAKKAYLAVGKRYSSLLRQIMNLDPSILKQAEEILITGNSLHTHDNRFLTVFYNELKTKSKIDKKYYDYLTELKKIKNELDISVHKLSGARVTYLLRKAGIPPRKVNYARDTIAAQINSKEISLLEKISLPGILDVASSESLEELIADGSISCENGILVPRTKNAKDFIKQLETSIRQRFNDEYLSTADVDVLKQFTKLDTANLLDFIRLTADRDHLRELERKIDSGDISLSRGTLVPLNPRGKKYLTLLMEELTGQLHKKLKSQIIANNQVHVKSDPRIARVKKSLNDFDISYARHDFLGRLAGNNEVYLDLLNRSDSHRASLDSMFLEVMALQETISASFADIKKQLLFVVNRDTLDIDKILTLLVSVRYLSLYESKYENKLTELENKLGILSGGHDVLGPETLMKLHEKYGENISDPDVDVQLKNLITSRLTGRKALGPETNGILYEFILKSPQVREYKEVLRSEAVLKKHISDLLYHQNCLYSSLGNMSENLAELAELDLSKKEKLSDIIHETELAHKELWLAKMMNENKRYIENNYGDLPDATKDMVSGASREAISNARREVREALLRYRAGHKEHSDAFATELRKSLKELSGGGDISKISADLKAKYRVMNTNHEELITAMERDIMALEKRLLNFEDNSPQNIDKLLISDIRQNI